MYKKSNYNIKVDVLDNGDLLLFNTLTTAFGIMNKTTQKLYDKIEKFEANDIKELKDNREFETLVRNQYVIPKELNEIDILKTQAQSGKYSHQSLNLTIAPTLNCNMACPYCYETRKDNFMDENVKIVLYDFVKSYLDTNGCKNFHVTWYGGEPLLEIDTIIDLSSKFIKLCNDKNINYSASIVTNGVLLSQTNATILVNECNIKMAQITIDGMPEYHNNRRILIDGRDSFDIIINNIEDCKDILKISIRVNVDKSNRDNIEQLTNYFINEKGWIDDPAFYLAPVESYNDCFLSESCLNAEEFAELDSQLLYKLYDVNSTILKSKLYPSPRGNYCGAVIKGSYVVDPEGDLYTCWNNVGIKEKKIGNVIQMNQMNQMNMEYLKWISYEPKGKCLTCNILPICAGGCPYEFFRHNEPKCEKRIQNYKERLKLAYKEYLVNRG